MNVVRLSMLALVLTMLAITVPGVAQQRDRIRQLDPLESL
jgi:hypothetical protein